VVVVVAVVALLASPGQVTAMRKCVCVCVDVDAVFVEPSHPY